MILKSIPNDGNSSFMGWQFNVTCIDMLLWIASYKQSQLDKKKIETRNHSHEEWRHENINKCDDDDDDDVASATWKKRWEKLVAHQTGEWLEETRLFHNEKKRNSSSFGQNQFVWKRRSTGTRWFFFLHEGYVAVPILKEKMKREWEVQPYFINR